MHGHKTSHLQIRYFLALLWAHPILHISTIRVKKPSKSEAFPVASREDSEGWSVVLPAVL